MHAYLAFTMAPPEQEVKLWPKEAAKLDSVSGKPFHGKTWLFYRPASDAL